MALLSALTMALLATSDVLAQNISISIPSNPSTRLLLPDVYGYSLEPIWVDSYLRNRKAFTLLSTIGAITGKPPPIRVGGNTADQTYQHPTLSTGNASVALPGLPSAKLFNITPAWYSTWGDYFPPGTDLIYTLNFGVNESGWANAVAQAESAHAGLGSKLKQFELGNEIDHFTNKGWRDASWGVDTYIAQYRNLTSQIFNSAWYKNTASPPTFQAGVFADPPLVPDQQDEIDDFSIANLTRGGTGGILERKEDREKIASFAVHLYPQSSCDPGRWHRMRLDLLSNHTTLWQNVSQYIPQVAAADRAGIPFVLGETNSVSCGGRSGISDTLGAALWGVDYVLMAASLGIQKTYFHLGAQSEYASFTPEAYPYKNETLQAGIRPGWYAHYFVAKTVAAKANETLGVAALPGANSSALSGYGVYAGSALRKLVFLNMGVWNGTEGLSNPSTLSVTDGKTFSNGTRPRAVLKVGTPWSAGQHVTVTRLVGPGTNAKSNVTISGLSFDPLSGEKVGKETVESVVVGSNGLLEVSLVQAEGVLLEVADGVKPVENSMAGRTTSVMSTNMLASILASVGWMLM